VPNWKAGDSIHFGAGRYAWSGRETTMRTSPQCSWWRTSRNNPSGFRRNAPWKPLAVRQGSDCGNLATRWWGHWRDPGRPAAFFRRSRLGACQPDQLEALGALAEKLHDRYVVEAEALWRDLHG
jgi:hypothetical protein